MRLVNLSARQQGTVCQAVLEKYGDELVRGAMITADAGRVRIRPPEPKDP